MHYTSTMTSKGQVTVPVAIRRKLNLMPGQSVRFTVADGNVTIEGQTWRDDLSQLHKRAAAYMRKHNIQPVSDEELDRAINAAASGAATERHGRHKG